MLFCGEGTSFIASVGVSVILAGLLLYYFNIRLRALERTAQKQNQVLAGFLGGVQGNLVHGELGAASAPPGMMAGSAAPPAADAARCFAGACSRLHAGEQDRIAVSDDESVGAESASDSGEEYTDTETGSDSEDDGDVIDLGERGGGDAASEVPGVKVIELDGDGRQPGAEVAREAQDPDEALVADTIEVLKEAVESSVGRSRDPSPIAPAEPTSGTEEKGNEDGESATVIDRLKVAELREMVVDKSLATGAEARGMKKAQLLELLEPPSEVPSEE